MIELTREEVIAYISCETELPEEVQVAILASLKELAAIKSQPVPVEPVAWRWRPIGNTVGWTYDPDVEWLSRQQKDVIDKEPLYGPEVIDSLQSALQRVQEERDRHIGAVKAYIEDAEAMKQRAEKAEQANRRMVELLKEFGE